MPLATGQLLHAFVFDRDCFPKVAISLPSYCGRCADIDRRMETLSSTTPQTTSSGGHRRTLLLSLGQAQTP